MSNIKIGNKVFNNVESVQFPSANDPTFMATFDRRSIIADIIYPTEYIVNIKMVENEDGTAIVYMDQDTTAFAGAYPKPITTLGSRFILFCEEDEDHHEGCINGYMIKSLGGKPYYGAAEDLGYAFVSQRNNGFRIGQYTGSLYNSEWGTEEGLYSFLKYNSSQFLAIKNKNANFDTKKCRLYAFRYPVIQLSENLGDTEFVPPLEVIINE